MKPLHIGELYFPGAEASQGAEGLLPAWEKKVHWQGREREVGSRRCEPHLHVCQSAITDASVSIPASSIGSKFSGLTRLPP